MAQPSPLDDADYARFAWGRFRRILWWMLLPTLASIAGVIGWLWERNGPLPIVFMILVAFGVGATIMLAALLMGLMFLSSGTGHDEQIADPLKGEYPLDD